MLDYKLIGRLKESVRFTRNSREINAVCSPIGQIHVRGNKLWIADPAFQEFAQALPMRIPDGRYAVHAYRWHHTTAVLNVCVVIGFRPQRIALTRRLRIHNSIRPDLTDGVIVDTAEISIRSDNALTLQSGLGDGYYPVFANFNVGFVPQSVVVDFKLWETENVMLRPGQIMDEFGIIK